MIYCEINCTLIEVLEVCINNTDNKLIEIKNPKNIDKKNFLYISGISSIAPEAFKNSKLRDLEITGSSKYPNGSFQQLKLEENSFNGLENVEIFTIKNSPVIVDKIIFLSLKKLEYITLVIKINGPSPSIDLSYLQKLLFVDIFDSYLNKITYDLLNLPKNIERLSLINCNISTIEPKSFEKFNQLYFLRLNNNPLSKLEPNIFFGLQRIEIFELSSNKIVEIDENCFVNFTKLVNIHLDHNNLQIIKSYSFKNVIVTEALDLSSNNIVQLETNAFNNSVIKKIYSNEKINISSLGLLNVPEIIIP